MPGIRSVTAGGKDWAKNVAKDVYPRFADTFPRKMYWFITNGYTPHEWQTAFHSADTDGKLTKFRHLVAGRRGGKTLSAAWETVFYALHPEEFHRDAHGIESDKPLWIWVLAKDHELGFPARQAVQQVLTEAGLMPNRDYRWNRTEKKIEFNNGSLLQFKSADDPQSLRGAGLDFLWIDESAFIPTDEAWNVVRPALADKNGLVWTTTTPKGMNWFHEEFFSEEALKDRFQFRVEYTSIDSPYFSKTVWEYEKRKMPTVLFKQEYMAAFNAMAGVELNGEWLAYYSIGDPEPGEIRLPMIDSESGQRVFNGRKFIGVDPASSLSDRADYFAMALIGVSRDNSQAYILDTFKARIPFPDQLDKIRDWFLQYRPEYIGIESNAYQRVLAQQASRMEGLPPVVPVISRGKKEERIMAMAPLFKYKKCRIHKLGQSDFIEEWVSYDTSMKNPKDDLLDAVEIAISAAGVLLPSMTTILEKPMAKTIDQEAWEQIQSRSSTKSHYDPDLGDMA